MRAVIQAASPSDAAALIVNSVAAQTIEWLRHHAEGRAIMPFTLIKGRFKPKAGIPDGDSVRFLANNLNLWKRLEGAPVSLGTGPLTKDTAQLRLEGIDAIEKGATKPLSVDARNSLFHHIRFDEQTNPEPKGYILARMTDDQTRRPIAFAFAGGTDRADGANVHLDAKLLRKSVNYKQILDGFAYPLYYNTLFADLRETFAKGVAAAKKAKRGNWPTDKTLSGVTVTGKASLETYLRNNSSLVGFIDFLEAKNERIDILPTMNELGLQDIVKVLGNKVRMTVPPENIRVVGDAGHRLR